MTTGMKRRATAKYASWLRNYFLDSHACNKTTGDTTATELANGMSFRGKTSHVGRIG